MALDREEERSATTPTQDETPPPVPPEGSPGSKDVEGANVQEATEDFVQSMNGTESPANATDTETQDSDKTKNTETKDSGFSIPNIIGMIALVAAAYIFAGPLIALAVAAFVYYQTNKEAEINKTSESRSQIFPKTKRSPENDRTTGKVREVEVDQPGTQQAEQTIPPRENEVPESAAFVTKEPSTTEQHGAANLQSTDPVAIPTPTGSEQTPSFQEPRYYRLPEKVQESAAFVTKAPEQTPSFKETKHNKLRETVPEHRAQSPRRGGAEEGASAIDRTSSPLSAEAEEMQNKLSAQAAKSPPPRSPSPRSSSPRRGSPVNDAGYLQGQ